MKSLFRPSVLIAISVALVAGAVGVWFRFRPEATGPVPLPVAPGDREVVWLYQATTTAAWERFVTAVKLTEERLRQEVPGIKAVVDDRAFPRQSTAVPEVSLTWDGAGGKIVFRWYKLTGDWKPREWLEALLKDRPAPLAIVGGSSSDLARDLAVQLRAATMTLPAERRPLLLLTTATADLVDWPASAPQPAGLEFETPEQFGLPAQVRLNAIYPGRTFRFCFDNRQMAETVTQFIWSRDDLRPDGDRVFMVQWQDDAYSRDLVEGFWSSCRGLLPADVTPDIQRVLSSFGTSQAANRFEVDRVKSLLDQLETAGPLFLPAPDSRRKRSLLVVAGQTLPARRFLGELARTDPRSARGFVVATGDALAFNTIYRDRLVTWPIQDLPYPLVMFCHANPVNVNAGFHPHAEGRAGTSIVGDSGATGTEDVLLFADIVGTVARAARRAGPLADAPQLADRMRTARYHAGHITFGDEGGLLFARDGNRASGTGEHVVCLLPQFQGGRALALLGGATQWIGAGMPTTQGGRALPRATIEVFAWRKGMATEWEPRCAPLVVSYEERSDTGGVFHD